MGCREAGGRAGGDRWEVPQDHSAYLKGLLGALAQWMLGRLGEWGSVLIPKS